MTNIAIFASGSGTNAENIINYFANSPLARVTLILSDNPTAPVLARADRLGIASVHFSSHDPEAATNILNFIRTYKIDYIVLAGYLSLIPSELISKYRERIINIHPSLLPKYGGRGMYGANVHRAIIAGGEQESGITIHHVNECYDQGAIIAQFTVALCENETPESLQTKIHALEYIHFPKIIEQQIVKLTV